MPMFSPIRTCNFAAMFVAAAACAASALAADRKPNVILFLVDDMGWMDCGAYGSRYYETPHIDAFARRGMRFTNAYAQPLCSPTRASLLTGKYPARHGITSATGHQPPQPSGHEFLPTSAPAGRPLLVPESKNYLEPSEYTLAEALHDAGYRTAHLGKWHLGLTPEHWPERQGFDVAFHCHPDPGPPGNYFSPYAVVAEGKPNAKQRTGTITDGPPGEYIVDRLADEAVRFIDDHRDRPFFLNLWNYGVHGPWGHREEYTRQFAGKTDPRGVQGNPIMASMLRSVDDCFGRVVEAVERNGLAEHTIILFNSDNGGNTHSNTPDDRKATAKQAARTPQLADWRRWAGDRPPTDNTPLRDGKGTLYEGGTRVPLVWSWPGRIASGTTSDAVVAHIDVYPTLLELLELKPPPQQTFDGRSYAAVLTGRGPFDRDALFNYFPHGRNGGGVWVRAGRWKLIRWFDPTLPRELYDLEADLSETKNLADEEPDRVRDLDSRIDEFLATTGAAFPRPNPAYRAPANPTDWQAGKDSRVEIAAGIAKASSDTGRATIQLPEVRDMAGEFLVRFRLRSGGGRKGLVLWGTEREPTFAAERRAEFTPTPDGQWHDYAVRFTASAPLRALRIDASLSPATVEFDTIRLERADGTLVKQWDF